MAVETDCRRGRQVISAMHVHSVFVTRYRRGVLNDEMPTVCEEAMRKVCIDFEAELTEFNGETDHVHLLVNYPPKVAVSSPVNSLKGVSSRILRRDFTGRVNRAVMHGHFWSPSYFAASCGGAPLTITRQYIEQQQRPVRRSALTDRSV
ncbi:IS200/IS605 family transposase [Kitasatospora sp. NPDC096077]|uniref:IS200/IS605 family transposase n=1 Tax=Kitasatospora sp. NPDC096077 TaxID=3155544 RepID=UPI00331C8C79